MSMISPELFIELECRGKSYEELLQLRDEMLERITAFEKGTGTKGYVHINPSPDVVYWMDLKYLSEVCLQIAGAYEMREDR